MKHNNMTKSIETNDLEHEKLNKWFYILPLRAKRFIHMRGLSWKYNERMINSIEEKEKRIKKLEHKLYKKRKKPCRH